MGLTDHASTIASTPLARSVDALSTQRRVRINLSCTMLKTSKKANTNLPKDLRKVFGAMSQASTGE
jgi:hypothetical protein